MTERLKQFKLSKVPASISLIVIRLEFPKHQLCRSKAVHLRSATHMVFESAMCEIFVNKTSDRIKRGCIWTRVARINQNDALVTSEIRSSKPRDRQPSRKCRLNWRFTLARCSQTAICTSIALIKSASAKLCLLLDYLTRYRFLTILHV